MELHFPELPSLHSFCLAMGPMRTLCDTWNAGVHNSCIVFNAWKVGAGHSWLWRHICWLIWLVWGSHWLTTLPLLPGRLVWLANSWARCVITSVRNCILASWCFPCTFQLVLLYPTSYLSSLLPTSPADSVLNSRCGNNSRT